MNVGVRKGILVIRPFAFPFSVSLDFFSVNKNKQAYLPDSGRSQKIGLETDSVIKQLH